MNFSVDGDGVENSVDGQKFGCSVFSTRRIKTLSLKSACRLQQLEGLQMELHNRTQG